MTEKPTTFRVDLTPDELLHLDGLCRPEAQIVVDQAKLTRRVTEAGASDAIGKLVAEAVAEARKEGKLGWRPTQIRNCSVCGKSGGYVLFKSGPRRGRPNYDRPIHLGGVELSDRGIYVQGHATVGGCGSCVDTALPMLRDALSDVRAQVPDRLAAEGRTRWEHHHPASCTVCGWSGHTGQLGWLRTLMGDGWYRGGCPACPAENQFMSTKVEKDFKRFVVVDGAGLVPNPGRRTAAG